MLKRTLSLCMAILLTICAGSCSLYPIYTNYFKKKLSYSLTEINFYGSFINVGLWACILMGLLYDSVGTTASTAISFLLLPGSYFFIYNISNSNINSLNIFWLIILGFILGEGSALLYTNALATSIKNFYKSCSSDIVGLIVSNMAISPCVFYSYSDMFKNGLTVTEFLFLVLFIITIIIFFGVCLFDYYEPSTSDEFKLKMFKLNKQSLIVKIFSMINLYSLIIFLILVVINSIFNIKLPHYLIFPFTHILYIIVVILEGFKVFDNKVVEIVERSHGKFEDGDFSREIIIKDEINKENTNVPILNNDINIKKEIENSLYNVVDKSNDDKKENMTVEYKQKNDNLKEKFNLKLENQSIIRKEMSENYKLDKNLNNNIRNSDASNESNNTDDNINLNKNENNNDINIDSNPNNKSENLENNRESITSTQYENNNISNININNNINQEIRPSIISNSNYENNQIRSDLNRNRQEKILSKVNNSTNFNMINNNQKNNNSNINFPKTTRSNLNTTEMNSFVNDITRTSIMQNQIIEEDPSRDQIEVLKTLFKDQVIQCLFALLFITIGCMISNLNNIKFIVLSINSSKKSLDEYPLLYFAFNSLSRIIASYLLKGVIHSQKVFLYFIIIIFIGFFSQFLGIFMNENLLYLSISLAGLTHGSIMAFVPLYCRFVYDLRDIGTVLGILTTGNALGSLVIGALIFPSFYVYYSENEYCGGTRCFRGSFVLNTLFMIFDLFVCYVTYLKDKSRKELEEIKKEQMYKDQSISVISFSNEEGEG